MFKSDISKIISPALEMRRSVLFIKHNLKSLFKTTTMRIIFYQTKHLRVPVVNHKNSPLIKGKTEQPANPHPSRVTRKIPPRLAKSN